MKAPNTPNAYKLGRLYGRNVYRFVVVTMVRPGDGTSRSYSLEVTAHTADDAIHYAHRRCLDVVACLVPDSVESVTYGPRGGLTERYAGVEPLVGHAILYGGERNATLQLFNPGV